MKDLRVAAVQMISGPEVAPNLATAGRLIAQAAAQGAQLIVLPEYFPLIGATDADRLAAREPNDATGGAGPIQDFLAGAARRHGIWLVGGSIPTFADDPDKLRNTCLVFDDAGRQVARYDKIHLFGFHKGEERYDEAATIEGGDLPVAFDTPWGRVGMGICYDLRFPELFRALAQLPSASSTCWCCRPPSPRPPAAPTGSCCCARAPWRINAMLWHRPRAGSIRTAVSPMATA